MTLNAILIVAWLAGIGLVALVSYPITITPRFAKKQNRGIYHA